MDELLIEEYRGQVLENVHRGHICGVSSQGLIEYYAGDVDHMSYFRSSAKPIQVLPLLVHGFDMKFNLTDREIAVMAGSHRGEDFHIRAIESIMKKIGVTEEDIICKPTYPGNEKARGHIFNKNSPARKIYHNCSGKHLGLMALCKGLGCGIEKYWHIDSPVQREILKYLSLTAQYPQEDIKTGIDGCGVPVFAMPLKFLANSYLRLACPDLIINQSLKAAADKITNIMNDYYEMITGTNFICSTLLTDRNIVAKGGAKGVYCFGLKNERTAFALKVMDGSEEGWPLIIASILEQINYKNRSTIQKMYDLAPIKIKNDNDKIIGYNKVCFKLWQGDVSIAT